MFILPVAQNVTKKVNYMHFFHIKKIISKKSIFFLKNYKVFFSLSDRLVSGHEDPLNRYFLAQHQECKQE